ncbi:hypothetical protein D3C76_1052600 [compost metagenome]
MQAVQRQAGGQAEVVFQTAEIGGDQLLQRLALKDVVGALEGGLPVLRQVEDEDRLVDLHPLDTLRGEALEDFTVERQQALQQVQLVELGAFHLAQPEVGQRADHYRLHCMTEGFCFLDFLEELFPAQLELLIGAEFRHQVVVVGIEPLGHFLGVGAAATTVTDATGHAEQGLQGRLAAIVGTEALGDHAEGQRVGQHLVVPGEITDRQQVDAGVPLCLPVCRTQLATDGAQPGFVDLAFPEGFLSLLQFAVAADAREAKGMSQSHGGNLQCGLMPHIVDSGVAMRQTQSIRVVIKFCSY